jgi:hypothetical protein
VVQKSHDKTGLGFKEFSSPLISKSIISPKEKEEHTQNSNVTYQNNKNAQINKRSQNHTFRYRYDYMRNKNHNNYHYNNRNIINLYWSNKIYSRDQMVVLWTQKSKYITKIDSK